MPIASLRGGNAVSKWLGRTVLRSLGWRAEGQFPEHPKFIITLAPHSSNWDFVIGVAILLGAGVKIKFLIKHSLFIWPFSCFLRKIGGIPVDRRSPHGVVGQMINHFENCDQMILALAPEGTRKQVKQWKVGFLHIAHGADIPVVPLSLDYHQKLAVLGPALSLSGDLADDLATVKACYLDVQGKNGKVS